MLQILIPENDCQRLQVFRLSICKSAQNLPSRTISDICESLLSILSISTEIDTRKHLFFGLLYRISYQTLQNFLVRLFSYFKGLGKSQDGFIPDIDILNLMNMISWLTCISGLRAVSFHKYYSGKTLQDLQLSEFTVTCDLYRMSNNIDFSRF